MHGEHDVLVPRRWFGRVEATKFQFVEIERDFLKFYRDRAQLGTLATEPLLQLPASEQAEFLASISFSQVPGTLQLL